MKRIVWVASYPKSGNTWLRVFLLNLQRDADQPVDINQLGEIPIASSRLFFDDVVGIEASDLDPDEIARLRPGVYEQLAAEAEDTQFLKIHDAQILTPDNVALVSEHATAAAIYVIRNPLDVAISLAHHNGSTIDAAIERMGNSGYAFSDGSKRLYEQLRQSLLSWSEHVRSWLDAAPFPVHLVRYEDLQRRGEETFAGVARFAGLPSDVQRIERAMRFSRFDELQRQEQQHGFKERSPQAEVFFRKGQVGGWREVLSEQQVARVIGDHADVMRRFDYLTSSGEPTS